MANSNKDFLERLKENEKVEGASTFGRADKTSLEPRFVGKINQVEGLSKEEREILQVVKIMEAEKHLKSIRTNILFFVWITIIGFVVSLFIFLNRT